MLKYSLLVVGTLLFLFGCKKEEHPVPNYRFTAYVDLMLPDYNQQVFTLRTDSYGARVGVAGVIVYRLAMDEYYAFERYCPHDKDPQCAVAPDEDPTLAVCPCCGSKFLLLSEIGDVVEGPSAYSLKRYKTRVEGSTLIIYN
ncbi:Rieske (2Fe-2S) protein [Geofilum rhodophaeum]|uniref:Rieske (2Fe-2S) protein n=1 Tax=Geofilum rhodophaeum TaxID=1965019 RepID=UPI001314BFD7|nr:Rieske 2Fe-2S domain-containing protein [Geofilum rhodophaeum]